MMEGKFPFGNRFARNVTRLSQIEKQKRGSNLGVSVSVALDIVPVIREGASFRLS